MKDASNTHRGSPPLSSRRNPAVTAVNDAMACVIQADDINYVQDDREELGDANSDGRVQFRDEYEYANCDRVEIQSGPPCAPQINQVDLSVVHPMAHLVNEGTSTMERIGTSSGACERTGENELLLSTGAEETGMPRNVVDEGRVLTDYTPSHSQLSIDDACEAHAINTQELPDVDLPDGDELLREMRKNVRRLRKTSLIGICLKFGKPSFTSLQYETMSLLFNDHWKDFNMPCEATVRKQLWTHLKNNVFPKHTTLNLPCRLNATMPDEISGAATVHNSNFLTKAVSIVMPSTWAAVDIGHIPFLEAVYGVQSSRKDRSIEDCPISYDPKEVSMGDRTLWLRKNRGYIKARRGDVISCWCPGISTSSMLGEVRQEWNFDDICQDQFQATVKGFWEPGSKEKDGQHYLFPTSMSENPLLSGVIDFLLDHICVPSECDNSSGMSRSAIMPGDLCSILTSAATSLRRSSFTTVEHVAVLVNRFWRSENSPSSDRIMWFRTSHATQDSGHGSMTSCVNVSLVEVTLTTGVPVLFQSFRKQRASRRVKASGRLKSGQKYYIYRIVLYTDDFNPSSLLYPRGSNGGCYMQAVGLPRSCRLALSCIRPLALTPTGVKSNMVLDALLPDLVHGATSGFEVMDGYGQLARVFIDVVGFLGDYHGTSDVLDVMKQSARAPCPCCTFRKRSTPAESNYAYSATLNCRHSSFTRGLFRMKALRSSGLSEVERKWLGMSSGTLADCEEQGKWPMVKLAIMLSQHREDHKTPGPLLTNENCLIDLTYFDPYSRNIVAPDHCICGLIGCVLTAVFAQTENKSNRSIINLALCAALRQVGVTGQATLYNFQTEKVNSASMSTLYGIGLVLPAVLCALKMQDEVPIFGVLVALQKLIALLFWWPSMDTDHPLHFAEVHGKDTTKYYTALQHLATKFIVEVSAFCCAHPDKKQLIDRPNVHRLLELVVHTVPLYGHASLVGEMLFESMHQPLKRSLSKDTSPHAHNSAIIHAVCHDWLHRIAELSICTETSQNCDLLTEDPNYENGAREERMEGSLSYQEAVRMGIRRLFSGQCAERYELFLMQRRSASLPESSGSEIGVASDIYDLSSAGATEAPHSRFDLTSRLLENITSSDTSVPSRDAIRQIDDEISASLKGGVMKYLQSKFPPTLVPSCDGARWYGYEFEKRKPPSRFSCSDTALLRSCVQSAMRELIEHLPDASIFPLTTVRKAIFRRKTHVKRFYPHHVLRVGDCVEITASPPTLDDDIILSLPDGAGVKGFYFIHGLFGWKDGHVWAGVHRLMGNTGGAYKVTGLQERSLQLAHLSPSTRKVGLLHACEVNNICDYTTSSKSIRHSLLLENCDFFRILTRREGYPPRRS